MSGDEDVEEEKDEEEQISKTTREHLDELGFYDNEFTEFPPELSGVKRFKVERNAEPIIEALQLPGFDIDFMKVDMIEALGRIGDEKAVPVLLDYVDDRDMQVNAMDALGMIGSNDAVERLSEFLDPDKKVHVYVKVKAAETLGEIGEGGGDALIDALGDESASVRSAAANSLGEIGYKDAVGDLAELLDEDEEESVRLSAARALRSIGTDEALEVLSGYGDDDNELVADAASV